MCMADRRTAVGDRRSDKNVCIQRPRYTPYSVSPSPLSFPVFLLSRSPFATVCVSVNVRASHIMYCVSHTVTNILCGTFVMISNYLSAVC